MGRSEMARSRLPLALAVAAVIRLALLPVGGYGGDMEQFAGWAHQLASHPPWEFYAAHHLILDHLPGDLWILLLAARLHLLLPAVPLPYLVKGIGVIADLGVGAVLYRIVCDLGGERNGLIAASLYLFNPPIVFLSAIWGQWDAVSGFFTLLALLLLLRGRIVLALPALTYAVLVKPPLAVLGPLVVLAIVARKGPVPWRAAALGAAGSLLLAALVLIPFGVGIPPLPMRWSLLDRLAYAWNYRTYTTTSAFNLWATPLGGHLYRDNHHLLPGVTYAAAGSILLLGAVVAVLALYARRPAPLLLLWAAHATMFAVFLFPTRQHERYLMPALLLAAVPAAVGRRMRALYLALSATFLINLYYIYSLFNPAPHLPAPFGTQGFIWAVAGINVALFAVSLWIGAVESSMDEPQECSICHQPLRRLRHEVAHSHSHSWTEIRTCPHNILSVNHFADPRHDEWHHSENGWVKREV